MRETAVAKYLAIYTNYMLNLLVRDESHILILTDLVKFLCLWMSLNAECNTMLVI